MGEIKKLGIIPIVLTPFDENEELDTERLGEEIDWVIEKLAGHNAVLLFYGTMGEYMSLNESERVKAYKAAVDYTNGRYPVMLGVSDANQTTRDSVKFAKLAEDAGADIILLKTPSYLSTENQAGSAKEKIKDACFAYFEAVSNAINIPIMLYNTGKMGTIQDEYIIAALAEKGYIQYIKECIQTPNRFEVFLSLTDKLGVCGCTDRQCFQGLLYHGTVSCYGMVVPEMVTALMDFIEKGDLKAALREWIRQQPLVEGIEFSRFNEGPGYGTQNEYYALACRGMPVGRPRSPQSLLTEAAKIKIKSLLEEFGIETVSPIKEYW